MKEIDLAALLCSRLCHDLISPVSAVSNGMEILDDETDPEMREQVFDLIRKSSQQSSDSVQFFRVAFGAGGGVGDQVEVRTIVGLIENFLNSKKIKLIESLDIEFLTKEESKLLMNLTLIASESLVRGGEVSVKIDKSNGSELVLAVKGATLILYPPIKEALKSQIAITDYEPKTAPLALVFDLLNSLNAGLTLDDSLDGELVFKVNW